MANETVDVEIVEVEVVEVLDPELVDDDTAATDTEDVTETDADDDEKRAKTPNFHRLPNSETFHLVRGERGETVEDEGTQDVNADIDAAEGHEGDEQHRASFHRLPNKETFHLVREHGATE